MTGAALASRIRRGESPPDRVASRRQPSAQPVDMSRPRLPSPANLLAMQRSAGNQAVVRYIARVRSDTAARVPVQRRIERGSGTGWGAIGWVTGGEAIWNRIDRGFNTDLFQVRSDLRALADKASTREVTAALQSIEAFIRTWDNRAYLYFEANPAQKQPINAATFADRIDAALARGRAAIEAATPAETKTETEPEPVLEPELEPKPTPRQQAAKKKKLPRVELAAPLAQVETPSVKAVKAPKAAPKVKASTAKLAAASQARAENVKLEEERQRANAAKKERATAKTKSVTDFGVKLASQTSALISSEKIRDFQFLQTWAVELDKVMVVAKQRALGSQDADITPQLRQAYDAWTRTLGVARAANVSEKRGTAADWRTWTGIDSYDIMENLPGAQFTPARPPVAPVEGPTTADGVAPLEPEPPAEPDPIPIHVTYDTKAVRAPTGQPNGLTADQVVNDVLSVSAVGERIHATLEKTRTDKYPHVYWGGSDLGLGTERYPEQWSSIPPGWQPGAEGPTARPKVEQVLNDYVSSTIVPKVRSNLTWLTYTNYAWPTFDAMKG